MPQNFNDGSDKPKTIANVVGKHADRVMDGLFSEIEEMLNAEPQEKQQPAHLRASSPVASTLSEPYLSADRVPGEADRPLAGNTSPERRALPESPPPARRRWPKVLAIGGTLLLAISGILWWLQSQGKINLAALAKGESPVLLSNSADVKFSDYLRHSLGKIDSKTAAIPNPATATTVSPSSPAATNATNINATLTKIVPGSPPVVEFAIDGKTQQFKGGDQVGNSGWIITNAVNNEVLLKRNGESRSLKVNDRI